MPGQWFKFSGLLSSCASLVLVGVLATGAAHADPLYLPTPMGTERFARSAVNSSVLKVFAYAETESRQTFCGPTSLAIVLNSLGLSDPTPPSLFPYHLVTQDTVFTPANLLVKSYDEVDRRSPQHDLAALGLGDAAGDRATAPASKLVVNAEGDHLAMA
jgi:hypothetical protein